MTKNHYSSSSETHLTVHMNNYVSRSKITFLLTLKKNCRQVIACLFRAACLAFLESWAGLLGTGQASKPWPVPVTDRQADRPSGLLGPLPSTILNNWTTPKYRKPLIG